MNITKAKYQKIELADGSYENNGIITTVENQEMFVPIDSANRHYQAIQEWIAAGNKIEDAD
tara:strand:+ start:302 stop:484 length:183 start_codon:yes stop_codon:yes gene_type:complete